MQRGTASFSEELTHTYHSTDVSKDRYLFKYEVLRTAVQVLFLYFSAHPFFGLVRPPLFVHPPDLCDEKFLRIPNISTAASQDSLLAIHMGKVIYCKVVL